MGNMSGDQRSKGEINITYMMICIVTLFVISFFLAYIRPLLLSTGILKPTFHAYVPVWSQISNILVTFNSTVNTFIYCVFNKKFRNVLFQWFPLKKGLPPVKNLDDERPKATWYVEVSNYIWFVIIWHVFILKLILR